MEKQDKKIVCKDCHTEFVFTVGEQNFYEEKGFTNEPIRCRACRDKRKAEKLARNQNENNNSN